MLDYGAFSKTVPICMRLALTVAIILSFAPKIPLQPPVFAASVQQWFPYNNRYAVIVMGGDVAGQTYTYYWQDTYGMYQYLITLGFTAENVYFLSYGSDADAHPEAVDRVSTKANVQWAFAQVKAKSTKNDLVYIFWVDHGNPSYFLLHKYETITHAEYNDCIKNIAARVIIGAYNPCYSGAVIPHISRPGVISITSQDASHENSAGWAGWWRTALAGGTSDDPSDKNGDGRVDMAEAFEWVAPKSKAWSPPEHPLFDDNGDGVGSEYNSAGYSPGYLNRDGFRGKWYSLTAWSSLALMATERIQYHVSTVFATVSSTTTTATSTRPAVLSESESGTTTRTTYSYNTGGAAPHTVTIRSTYTSAWTWTETRWSYSMHTVQSTTTTLSKTSSSTGLTTVTIEGTVNEMPLIVEYILMRITYGLLVQAFSFAQLVRHVFTGPVVQVTIIEYRGRVYGPPPPEPTLLDIIMENAPLIAGLVSAAVIAALLVMKKKKIRPIQAAKTMKKKLRRKQAVA